MTNHVHLLLTPDTAAGVSRLMQDIGTLFERRFKSSLVDSEAHCLACYRYIELNPVRAAMVISPEIETQLKLKLGSGKVGRPRKEI